MFDAGGWEKILKKPEFKRIWERRIEISTQVK